MFSTLHFVWLGISVALIIAGSIVTIKKNISLKTTLSILCAICVASEIVKIFYVMIRGERFNDNGYFIKETDLPFHLCSLQLFFAFVARFTQKQKVRDFCINFMIPTCAIGGTAALLIVTVPCVFTNVRTYQYFVYHISLIWFAVVAIKKSGLKLDVKAMLKMLVGLGAIVYVTFYINGFFQNTNFLYLSEPPMDGLPILNMDNGWFVYFISYMVLALVLITLFYVPFWIYYKVKKKSEN